VKLTRRLVLPRTLQARWERRGHDERLSGDEITLVLVMSYHAHTFGSLRLCLDSRELPRDLCRTLGHREDLSFAVDEQELHDFVSPARHRRRCNTEPETALRSVGLSQGARLWARRCIIR
jgi:hypothetical protein